MLEAGLPTPVLEAELGAMADAARRAAWRSSAATRRWWSTGEPTACTSRPPASAGSCQTCRISAGDVRPGDRILLSGFIGDHGVTILLARGDLELEADLASDTRSVLPMVQAVVRAAGPAIRWMRDPTRGGVATALNELARDCGLSVHLFEECVPVRDGVRGACELLGLDPLHIANEGQFVAVVRRKSSPTRRWTRCDVRRVARTHVQLARCASSPPAPCLRPPDTAAPGSWTCWSAIRCRASAGADMATACALAARVEERLAARNLLCEAFFTREADRLAEACRAMSDRFLQGGRLLAFGRGSFATDAQHVSVEFVHPVIVGKRALPALDLSSDSTMAGRHPAATGHRHGLWPAGWRQPRPGGAGRGRCTGAMTFALPGARGSYAIGPAAGDPFIHQEILEILYHTLWETVHVFLERRELGHDVGEAGFLYPFLGRERQPPPTP